MTLRLESGDDAVLGDYFEAAVLLAAAREPYALIEQAVVAAAALSGGARPLSEKELPPNLDVFGWCSWDRWAAGLQFVLVWCMWAGLLPIAILLAPRLPSPSSPAPCCSFYSAVSASGLSEAVQSLSSGGTPPRWVVIDDGWQCTEVDEPYRNIPTEQLKQQTAKMMQQTAKMMNKTPAEDAEQVRGRAGRWA
jgi:raffinose synthase